MKSKITKAVLALVVTAAFIDWPVRTEAVNGKALGKVAEALAKDAAKGGEHSHGLFESCSHSTKDVEEGVNKATQDASQMDVNYGAAANAAARNAYSDDDEEQ